MNAQQLSQLSESAGDAAPHLIAAAARFDIDTPLRQAHWLAQLAHESAGFSRLVENLNYRAESLVRMFGSRFSNMSTAQAYAHKPEAIANRAYGNRLGNGDEASGDGWAFRGRGYVQITGRKNYTACSLALFGDARLLDAPELLEAPEHAAQAAGWFWLASTLNRWADRDDVAAVSGLINRGDARKSAAGIGDRMQWLDLAKQALGISATVGVRA